MVKCKIYKLINILIRVDSIVQIKVVDSISMGASDDVNCKIINENFTSLQGERIHFRVNRERELIFLLLEMLPSTNKLSCSSSV